MTRARGPGSPTERRSGRARTVWSASARAEGGMAASSLRTERTRRKLRRCPRRRPVTNLARASRRKGLARERGLPPGHGRPLASARAGGPRLRGGTGSRVVAKCLSHAPRDGTFRPTIRRPPSIPGTSSDEDHDRVLHGLNVRAPRRQAGGGDPVPLPRRLDRARAILGRSLRGQSGRRSHLPEVPGRASCRARRSAPTARRRPVAPAGPAASGVQLLTP